MYHAEATACIRDLNYIIDTLMPEGFTSAAIKPGCSLWTDSHRANLHNMFDILKERNSNAPVRV